MNRRVILAIAAGCCATAPATSETRPPNVVLIISDDAGYNDIGVYGGSDFPTPELDRLASDGVRFTQGYVCASVCHPSRAGILTGRYPHRFGQEFNGPNAPAPGFSRADMGLDVGEQTIANAFQRLGYRTIEIGKWHMGGQLQFNPLNRGFNECFLIESGNRSYFPYPGVTRRSKRIYRNREPVPESEITYVTDSLTEAAVDFIKGQAAKPFFVYLSYTAVHTPLQAKSDDLEAMRSIQDRRRRTYAAMFKALDEGVGRVRNAIEQEGLTDNTLVVFVNDNGGPSGNGSSNYPLRGGKGTHLEGGNRVALMMSLPTVLAEGSTYELPVSSLDILPTTIAAAGGVPPTEPRLDGVNLLPYLAGEVPGRPHETLYWRRSPGAAIRDGDWKLLRVDGLPTMLFDLAADATESKNLINAFPAKAAELSKKLSTWEADLPAPKWTEGERWAKHQKKKHREAMADIETLPATTPEVSAE